FTAATTAAAGVTAPLRPRRAPLGSTGLFAASPTFLLLQVAVERLLFALPLGVGPLHFGDETLRFFVKRPRRLDQLARPLTPIGQPVKPRLVHRRSGRVQLAGQARPLGRPQRS